MEILIKKKMKKLVYKSGTVLTLAALLLLSLPVTAQEVTKEFHKEYKAGKGTTLDISNRYGDVVVENWDKDQIVIDVKVTLELPDKSKAEKLIGYIDVQFNEGTNQITVKTVIDDKFNYSGWGNKSRKFSIDYTVKMPAVSNLTLANRYGNSNINEIQGLVDLNQKYGDLTVNKLTRGNEKPLNKVNVAYGKGLIDEAGWLDVYVRYCNDLKITKSQAILLDSRYSKIIVGDVSSIVGETRYGELEIDRINNLVLNVGYLPVSVSELMKKMNLKGSYGSVSVDKVANGFESIEVDVDYMEVKLGIDESASYNLDAQTSYSSLKYNKEKFRSEQRIVENNSTSLVGKMGKETNPSAKVKISASYGEVRLMQ
jgi:hypothetical protein